MTKYDLLVPRVQGIIDEYSGMRLTLRQIYYRLVAGQFIANTVSQYKGLSKMLVDARLNGDISFSAIEDRTRGMDLSYGTEEAPKEYFNSWWSAIEDLATDYGLPTWWKQPIYVQVWVEKEALSRIFGDVTHAEGVDLAVCRGYPSLTFVAEAATDLRFRHGENGREWSDIHVLYFGDYDPSGLDIERYIEERLRDLGAYPKVRRVVLNREQVDEFQLPPAPAKTSDSRYWRMEMDEGEAMQVEMDAIEPRTLQGLVRDAIREHFDDSIDGEREQEISDRQERIQEWLDNALNPDFEPPEGD